MAKARKNTKPRAYTAWGIVGPRGRLIDVNGSYRRTANICQTQWGDRVVKLRCVIVPRRRK